MCTLHRTIILACALSVLGAGCFELRRIESQAPESQSAFDEALEGASSTFGESASTIETTPPEEKRWDVTRIAARKVDFVPSQGMWVYLAENTGQFYIVPGVAPTSGSPDPYEVAVGAAVATMYPVIWDPESFPTWERFALTMAQFACTSGTTDTDFVVCLDDKSQVLSGSTDAGLPYEKFALPSVRKLDQTPQGLRHYIVVRLGSDSEHGILVTVTKADYVGSVLSLAATMSISE